MPLLATDGADLYFEETGSGRPLLLIAGVASDGSSWAPLMPLIEDRFRLIVPDNRGVGQTRHDGPIRFDDFLSDILALLDHLGIERIDIAGHSLGGLIGLHLAARHPDRVSKLVTMGSGADAKSLTLLQDLAALYESAAPPRLYFRFLYQFLFSVPFFENPTAIDATVEAAMNYAHRQSPADFRRQVEMFDTLGMLDTKAVTAPVLAIAGGADLLAPPTSVTMLHAGIPNLRDVVIPSIGHSTHWEAPVRVAELIRAFMIAG